MSQGPLFTAVNARCRHSLVAKKGETGCSICRYERFLLSKKPPFPVKCIDANGIALEKGKHYTVLAVIRDGETESGEGPGFLLESMSGNHLCTDRLYKVHHFEVI